MEIEIRIKEDSTCHRITILTSLLSCLCQCMSLSLIPSYLCSLESQPLSCKWRTSLGRLPGSLLWRHQKSLLVEMLEVLLTIVVILVFEECLPPLLGKNMLESDVMWIHKSNTYYGFACTPSEHILVWSNNHIQLINFDE